MSMYAFCRSAAIAATEAVRLPSFVIVPIKVVLFPFLLAFGVVYIRGLRQLRKEKCVFLRKYQYLVAAGMEEDILLHEVQSFVTSVHRYSKKRVEIADVEQLHHKLRGIYGVMLDPIKDVRSRNERNKFDAWMQSGSQQTTETTKKTLLEQQVCLAKQLHDLKTQDDSKSVAEIILDLQSLPFDGNLVSWKGIQVDWLLDSFFIDPFITRLTEYDCELWFVRKVCIVEILRRRGICQGCFLEYAETTEKVGITRDTPSVFVSYTGRTPLKSFVHILEKASWRVHLDGHTLCRPVCMDRRKWVAQANNIQRKTNGRPRKSGRANQENGACPGKVE